MSKKIAHKSIKLALKFDDFVSRNPRSLRAVPRGAEIIITTASDKKLSEENLSRARDSRTGMFVRAHQASGTWRISRLDRPEKR